MNRKVTIGLLIAVLALLGGWDIYVYVVQPTAGGGTISEVVLGFSRAHPIVGFSMGVLCGHLLWPQKPKDVEPPKTSG